MAKISIGYKIIIKFSINGLSYKYHPTKLLVLEVIMLDIFILANLKNEVPKICQTILMFQILLDLLCKLIKRY